MSCGIGNVLSSPSAANCVPGSRSNAHCALEVTQGLALFTDSENECAGHGEVIGGASPLRGLSEATARRRQLHETEIGQWTFIVFPVRACGMEAGAEPQHRTQVNP